MNLVICGPADKTLQAELIRLTDPSRIVTLQSGGIRLEEPDASADARRHVEQLCRTASVDHAYIEAITRFADIKLLAMDMDSTLITIECIDEMADFAGKKKEISAITEAAMRGEIADFSESLRRRVALLAGTNASVMQRVFDERLQLTEGADVLLAAAHSIGIHTLLLSGGFTYFASRLQQDLDFDEAYANVLEVVDNKLTGRVICPIVDAEAKAKYVSTAMIKLNSEMTSAIVVGDGANDIPMMNRVEHSIAYHAKPTTTVAARFAIEYGTLVNVLDFFNCG